MPHGHCFSLAQVFKAISQSTTNTSLNLCNSSHAIQSQTHKLNPKGFSWLVMRLGCKQNMVFLGCKNLMFQERIHPQINPFLFYSSFNYLPFNIYNTQLLFLELLPLFLFVFILAVFTCCLLILLCVLSSSYHNCCHPINSPKFGTNLP